MHKCILPFFLLICFSFQVKAQSERYSKVRIYTENIDLTQLINSGVEIDHFFQSAANSIDVEISESEIEIMQQLQIDHKILIADLKAHYLSSLDSSIQRGFVPACGLQNFSYGTMGHYHSFDEVIANLDSMLAKFPNLITAKDSIGASVEGRTIYVVKISDNPNIDESADEATVYYDALHHAREPMSMEPLLYYMWWLLENYGIDEEATYLVNNREIYFIPVVNPDGYVYNQTTDPQGGGMWRKNRRNSGGGNFGIDLNRNYSSAFANPLGSSNNPSSAVYHGPAAFSEPETQAVRDYFHSINPPIVFTMHSHGQKFLISPGCFYPKEDFESYAEFSSEFVSNEFHGYGTTFEMLNYSSCGTARHYFHDNGSYAWVPEIGSSFWPPLSEFCSTIESTQKSLKYLSHVCGSYTRLNDFSILDSGYVVANDILRFQLRFKNRGLSRTADSVYVRVRSTNGNCTAIDSSDLILSIPPRSFASSIFEFQVLPGVNTLDTIRLQIEISEGDFITHTISKEVIVGRTRVIFEDDFESGMSGFTSSTWDTTFVDMQSGSHSIADSRYGNYESQDLRSLFLIPSIDLSNTDNPVVAFNAKWSFGPNDDVVLQVSTNGVVWTTLKTFLAHEHWTQISVSLDSYIGQMISLRFRLESDHAVQSDGFYFDDFRILDYENVITKAGELIDQELISIYPNPSNNFIVIRSGNTKIDRLEIYDMQGRIIVLSDVDTREFTLDIGELSAGTYHLKVYMNDKVEHRKILRQ